MRLSSAAFATLFGLAVVTGLAVTSCSSDGEPSASSVTTTTDSGERTETTEAATDDAELAAVVVFDVLATEPTDPGPHPELVWSAVSGAASYDLIVLDGAGDPYWAWSGDSTSVYLGGVQNPDAAGAWVFEPLTWIVTARDGEGEPLAMSARATLLP